MSFGLARQNKISGKWNVYKFYKTENSALKSAKYHAETKNWRIVVFEVGAQNGWEVRRQNYLFGSRIFSSNQKLSERGMSDFYKDMIKSDGWASVNKKT